ncbi:fucolectin-like [Haliotis asinina]|uniref:fucolectin-like n=1 Tax=Haliotis asinina TaxID=109174 RepID=UPI00353227BC
MASRKASPHRTGTREQPPPRGLTLPNLALNKPTHQSSTVYGGTSDRAVDGNNNPDFFSGSCTHAHDFQSFNWWQVDLLSTFHVISVSISNRDGDYYDRLTNFTVEVHAFDPMTSNNSGLQLCYWHEGAVGRGLTVDVTCAVNTIGRYVRIVKYNSGDKPLTLCEVEVRGILLRNTCGESPVVFSRLRTGVREPHYIIAWHENIGKLDCANLCLRMPSCNAFNTRSPYIGVVSCELLAVNLNPVNNASWGIYEISNQVLRT